MELHKNIVSLAGVLFLAALGPIACSSVPIKMQCSEIQARIDYGNLTGDQLRFAMQELDDCRGRQQDAERKDSGFVAGTEKRFTPESPTGTDSAQSHDGSSR